MLQPSFSILFCLLLARLASSADNDVSVIFGPNDEILYVAPGVMRSSWASRRDPPFDGLPTLGYNLDRWIRSVKMTSGTEYGICYRREDRRAQEVNNLGSLQDSGYAWLVTDAGSLLVVGEFVNGFEWGTKHIALGNNEDVVAAGEMVVSGDRIYWNLNSGSYMKNLTQTIYFEQYGVPIGDQNIAEMQAVKFDSYVSRMNTYWNNLAGAGLFQFVCNITNDKKGLLNTRVEREEAIEFCDDPTVDLDYDCYNVDLGVVVQPFYDKSAGRLGESACFYFSGSARSVLYFLVVLVSVFSFL